MYRVSDFTLKAACEEIMKTILIRFVLTRLTILQSCEVMKYEAVLEALIDPIIDESTPLNLVRGLFS